MSMFGTLPQLIATKLSPIVAATVPPAGASGEILPPILILMLCLMAGVGTMLLPPSKRDAMIARLGGVIVLAAALILAAMLVRYAAGTTRGGMNVYFWIFSAIALFGAIRVI